jgi:uncharacterized membrane protein YbhN (UPF0104 family)
MSSNLFGKFLLEEGLRQDALILNTSSQLGTKSGLFMVFAAFIFTAESTFVSLGNTLGLSLPHWPLFVSLILAMAGIAVLLWSARLLNYRMPPILSNLRAQAEEFFALPDIKNLPEAEKMQRLEDKFVNSLARSIEENFEANKKISRNLSVASGLVGASLSCLVLSLLWAAGKYLLHAFPNYHYLGLF